MTHLLIILYLSVKFHDISFISLKVIAETQFKAQSDQRPDCGIDFGCRDLTLVHNSSSHYALSLCEVSLNLLQ